MRFSVTIPAYKGKYLRECIDSVLAQTFTDFELVIVNDASPEDLGAIVNSYHDERVRYYVNETNCGAVDVVDNWNKCLEYATGDVGYFIKDSSGHVIQTANTNMAALCPLGQMTTNAAGAVSSIGSGIGSIAAMAAASTTGGGIAAAGALLVSAANTALSFNKRAASIKGGFGGQMAAAETNIFYTGYYMDTEDIGTSYVSQKGRPVAVTHAISNHSGYVQCDDASVSLGGESWERDEVNSYLNGGFFYE